MAWECQKKSGHFEQGKVVLLISIDLRSVKCRVGFCQVKIGEDTQGQWGSMNHSKKTITRSKYSRAGISLRMLERKCLFGPEYKRS